MRQRASPCNQPTSYILHKTTEKNKKRDSFCRGFCLFVVTAIIVSKMGSFQRDRNQFKNKKKLSKNKSIKLYKEKKSKIEQFQQEVQALKQKYNEVWNRFYQNILLFSL